MRDATKTLAGIGVAGLAAVTLAFTPADAGPEAPSVETPEGRWHVKATGVRIIGGYGDNFAYDGENVRPLEGTADVRLNTVAGTGEIVIEVETTPESGPIRFSEEKSFSGRIRIVQKLNTREMDRARLAEEVFLHGDTGNEAPVMPKIFNYFATWGPSSISVNGEEVIPMIGSHTMFSEEARGPSGKIVNARGEVYSPMQEDKTGFTDPQELEFHYVAHTTKPDQENFPPHSGWIHLHFSDVEVLTKPEGVEIPYASAE